MWSGAGEAGQMRYDARRYMGVSRRSVAARLMLVFGSAAVLAGLGGTCQKIAPTAQEDQGRLGEIATGELANTFPPGQDWKLTIPIKAGAKGTATLSWRAADWRESDVPGLQGSKEVELTGGDQRVDVTIPAPGALGWFRLRFRLSAEETELGTSTIDVAVIPSPKTRAEEFGAYVNMTGGNLAPDNIEKNLRLARRIGLGWGRSLFDWDAIEPRQDAYNWSQFDRLLSLAGSNEVRLLIHFPLSARWNSSAPAGTKIDLSDPLRKAGGWFAYPPKDLADYRDMVTQAVKRAAGRVKYWEVWNEPDLALYWKGKPSPAEYLEVLKVAYESVKRADPSAQVVVAAPFNPGDPSFIRRLIDLGGGRYFDVANSHMYGQMPTSPEQAISKLSTILEQSGARKPIFVTEFGWVIPRNRLDSERSLAIYLVKACATLRGAGVEKVFWHSIRGFGPEALMPENTSALVSYRMSPKIGYPAYATVVRELGGLEPARTKLSLPGGVEGEVFQAGGRRVGVFWTSGGERSVQLSTGLARAVVVDTMGNERESRAEGGRVTVVAGPTPVLVRY